MTGLCDMAERVLNCQARNGLATGILDWSEDLDDPAWATAAGLVMYAARLKQQDGGDERSPGLWGRLFG
jgi:cell division protein FtsA